MNPTSRRSALLTAAALTGLAATPSAAQADRGHRRPKGKKRGVKKGKTAKATKGTKGTVAGGQPSVPSSTAGASTPAPGAQIGSGPAPSQPVTNPTPGTTGGRAPGTSAPSTPSAPSAPSMPVNDQLVVPSTDPASTAVPSSADFGSDNQTPTTPQYPGSGSATTPDTRTGDSTVASADAIPTTTWTNGLPDAYSRHALSRLTYGISPTLLNELTSAKTIGSWIEAQYAAPFLVDTTADALWSWFPNLALDPLKIYANDKAGTVSSWRVMEDFARWTMLRRIYSRKQLFEQLVEFFGNHLYIPANTAAFGYRIDYDKVIRKYALGRYEDLLKAAITHPAMLVFLNAGSSRKTAVNENLGRELLELHTVGVGNYTESDVVNSARILTGYKVDTWNTWAASYDPAWHYTGTVKVGTFTHANTDPDGRAVTAAYLSYLAKHPATAQRLAFRMAQFFVSDTPPITLVTRLAQAYLNNDTSIIAMMRELVASTEFAASAGLKTVTPANDIVRTYRVLDVKVSNVDGSNAAKTSIIYQAGRAGMVPFSWPRPDGEPLATASWSSVGRVLGSFENHYLMGGRWYPSAGVTYRSPASWLPTTSLSLRDFVDHLCRKILTRPSDATILQAACTAVEYGPDTIVSATHPVLQWRLGHLISTLLNSPHHMMR